MRKNPHVRICGGLGSATTLVYPTLWLHCVLQLLVEHGGRIDGKDNRGQTPEDLLAREKPRC